MLCNYSFYHVKVVFWTRLILLFFSTVDEYGVLLYYRNSLRQEGRFGQSVRGQYLTRGERSNVLAVCSFHDHTPPTCSWSPELCRAQVAICPQGIGLSQQSVNKSWSYCHHHVLLSFWSMGKEGGCRWKIWGVRRENPGNGK